MRNEPLCCLRRLVVIATREARAADVQLAGYTCRNQMLRLIEHVQLDVQRRPSDGHDALFLACRTRRCRFVVADGYRRLAWSIRVTPFDLLSHRALPLRESFFERLLVAHDHTPQRARHLDAFVVHSRQPLEPERRRKIHNRYFFSLQ